MQGLRFEEPPLKTWPSLRDRLRRLREAESDDDLHDADVAFHAGVAVASRNDPLGLLLDAIAPLLRDLRTEAWAGWRREGGGREEIIEAHARIFECIARHDQQGAERAMLNHLRQARFGLEAPSLDEG